MDLPTQSLIPRSNSATFSGMRTLAAMRWGLVVVLASTTAIAADTGAEEPLVAALQRLAPAANPRVLELALQARDCASGQLGTAPPPRLAVIDYSLPSTTPRLWVFDLEDRSLLFNEYVAHGRGSGENMASRFSNSDGSHASSLGLFRTGETYVGHNGYSLRMEGLEPGTNDAAMAREIVVHGASYVDPDFARRQGRLGRSWGCPALRPAIAPAVIDSLRNGQMIFAYYPDTDWLTHSPFIDCRFTGRVRRGLVNAADVSSTRPAAAGSTDCTETGDCSHER